MDRTIIYPGALPLETDLLSAQRSAMVAIGHLAQATVGSATVVSGLACTPASGSLGVVVGPGSIFQMTTTDQNAFSSLAANSDALVKMGINTTATTFGLTAPTVAGQTISYLLEAAFLELDDTNTVLPYYNASAPALPFSGPGGAGGSQPTRRRQTCQLQLKAGVAAATGTQALPATDAGWVGLYRVDVNYGATGIATTDISTVPGAPFVGPKLPAINASITALVAEMAAIQAKEASDYAAAQAATAAVRPGTSAFLVTDGTPGIKSFTASWTGAYRVTVVGGGGGGGGCTASQSGGGGGAGGAAISYVHLNAGQVIQYVVGAQGLMGSDSGGDGGYGGTSSFGSYLAASGGAPGAGGQDGSSGGQGGAGTCAQTQASVLLYGGCGSDGSPGASTYGGLGGASYLGGGARGATADGILENGQALGSGGGGGYGGTAHGGGYGASGCVIVEG
ncbi:MAG: glycine-rich domain-containing protein [Janthinobacterium lividum]